MFGSSRDKITDVLLVATVVGFGVIIGKVNAYLEEFTPRATSSGFVGALPDGHAVRVLALGFDRLLADLFWIRTVYYIGDENSAAAGYPDVNRLAELVTDIDPKFSTVYVTMSGAISGLKGDPDGAIALLEKGIRNVDYWKLNFLLGFSYFIERFDYAAAAFQMQEAATKGGPSYLPLLASRLHVNAGDPETALIFIQARLREEKDPTTREALEKRYWDLWIHRDIDRIQQAIEAYRGTRGTNPETIGDLVEAGLLTQGPRDPRGGVYRIENGRAVTDLPYATLEMHVPYNPTRPRTVQPRAPASNIQGGAAP